MTDIHLLVTGCKGRMGQAIVRCAADHPGLVVTGQVDLGDDVEAVLKTCDTAIDFTTHSATLPLLNLCVAQNKRLVIGTTGHTEEERAAIRQAAQTIPIVFAANYSVGVNTLFWLTRRATEILGQSYDLEVVETHHRLKTDSPSGTARRLGEILAEASALNYLEDTRHGRHGDVGARTAREIGMHAVRGGDVVGDHTVIYAGIGERLELTHKASSRDTFANGALRAARWLADREAGLYDMQDVLGLS